MPTRIKRYEEPLSRLDELLARIEAEMGPDAEVERRDFKRGGFLGLGGTPMVELIATVEVAAPPAPSGLLPQPEPILPWRQAAEEDMAAEAEAAAPPAAARFAPAPAIASQPAAPVRSEAPRQPQPTPAAPPARFEPAPPPTRAVEPPRSAPPAPARPPTWDEPVMAEPADDPARPVQELDEHTAALLQQLLAATPEPPAAVAPPPAAPTAFTPPGVPAPAPATPPAAAPAPALVETPAREDLVELQASIRELQDTMRQLIEQQKAELNAREAALETEAEMAVLTAEAPPAAAPPGRSAQVVDPFSIDPARELDNAPRLAYDRLLEWNIGPYDALELINAGLTSPEGTPLDAGALLERISGEICRNVLLSGGIRLRQSPPGKVVALVGGTGVGKTTTIAKLAAGFAFQQGKRVSLVSLDNYRIAAAEQLRTYTDIMGIDLDIVFAREDFDAVLTERRQNDLVLIDTAGRSPLNEKQIYELREMFSAHPPDEVHLVLAAPTKADDLKLLLESFKPLSYDYIIVSKLDETRSLGCLYNINRYASSIAGRQVPISYFTVGQSVPEDLRAAELGFIQAWIKQGRIV